MLIIATHFGTICLDLRVSKDFVPKVGLQSLNENKLTNFAQFFETLSQICVVTNVLWAQKAGQTIVSLHCTATQPLRHVTMRVSTSISLFGSQQEIFVILLNSRNFNELQILENCVCLFRKLLASDIYKLPQYGQVLWIVNPTSSMSQKWKSRTFAHEGYGIQLSMDLLEQNGKCSVTIFTSTKPLAKTSTSGLLCRCVIKCGSLCMKTKYFVSLSEDWHTAGKRDCFTIEQTVLEESLRIFVSFQLVWIIVNVFQ